MNQLDTNQAPQLVAHQGPLIVLGGKQYVLPPMTLKIRRLDSESRRAMASGYDELKEQDLLVQVITLTLQRNYPQLQLTDLEDQVEYLELLEAYATLKEQEQLLLADMGKRVAAAAMGQAGR